MPGPRPAVRRLATVSASACGRGCTKCAVSSRWKARTSARNLAVPISDRTQCRDTERRRLAYNHSVLTERLEFAPERDAEVFSAVPAASAVFLLRGADAQAEPYVTKTANLRRRL